MSEDLTKPPKFRAGYLVDVLFYVDFAPIRKVRRIIQNVEAILPSGVYSFYPYSIPNYGHLSEEELELIMPCTYIIPKKLWVV